MRNFGSHELFHIPWVDHPAVFSRIATWLKPGGHALFTYATEEYTGSVEFNGYKDFMGQRLFYSHATVEVLHAQLAEAGLEIIDEQRLLIGGENFLWLTVRA